MMRNVLKTLLIALAALVLALPLFAQQEPPVNAQIQKDVVAAVKMHNDGNTPGAITELERLFRQDSSNIDVVNWLGYLYLKSGSPEKAVPVLARAVELQPASMTAKHDLAVAYMNAGRTEEATRGFEDLVNRNPDNGEYHATLGSLHLKAKNYDKAATSLGRAHALTPSDVPIMTNYASALCQAKREKEAIPVFEKLLAAESDNQVAMSWLGYLYVQENQPAKAITILEKARTLRPRDLEVLNNLGNAYVANGDDAKALEVYQTIASLNANLYQAWYNIGSIQLQNKRYSEAVDAFQQCISKNENDAFAHNNLGRAYEELGRTTLSADSYKKAADLSPGNKTFSRNAGLALVRDRRDADAVPYLERAIQQGADEPSTRLVLAEIYTRQDRPADAIRLLEPVSAEMSESAHYWYNLGVLRERTNDQPGAEAAYRKALAIDPTDLDAMNNLGLILYKTERYDEAVGHFEKLGSSNPNSYDAKLNLAAVYSKLDRTDEAIELWKSYLHAHGDKHEVRIDLANALWSEGHLETARFHYQFVLNRQPTNAPALNGVGLYSLYLHKPAEAEASFRKAIVSDRAFLPAYNNLAVTLERQNKVKEAIAVLEQALKINPEFEDARTNLDRLRATGG
jgi:tetratricopeptide (TPR) repeat protein